MVKREQKLKKIGIKKVAWIQQTFGLRLPTKTGNSLWRKSWGYFYLDRNIP